MAAGKPPPKKKPGEAGAAPSSGLGSPALPGANPLAKPKPAAAVSSPAATPPKPVAPSKPVSSPKPASAPIEVKIDPQSISDSEIEKKVFAILGTEKVDEPAIFRDFVEKIAPKIQLPETSREILSAFSSPDVTSDKIAATVRRNPYYEYQFLKVIESMSRREELPKLEGAIVMLGMQNSRNMLLAMQLLRSTRKTHPDWGKDGKLRIVPKEVLKYALKTEEALAGNKDAWPDIAYAAGMLFDLMMIVALDLSQDSKRVTAYVDNVYSHGLRSAKLGLEMSKKLPDFAFKKYIFSACLIHDIGKIAMAILEPTYLDFVDDCAKREFPRSLRSFIEERRFGVSHQVIGGMICHYYRTFRSIEKAILYHHDPFLIKDLRNLHQLASMVALATNVANHFKKADKPDDPILEKWKGLELRDFRYDIKDVMAAVQKSV